MIFLKVGGNNNMESINDYQIGQQDLHRGYAYVEIFLYHAMEKPSGIYTQPFEEIIDLIYELDLPDNVLLELYWIARRKYFGPRFNEV